MTSARKLVMRLVTVLEPIQKSTAADDVSMKGSDVGEKSLSTKPFALLQVHSDAFGLLLQSGEKDRRKAHIGAEYESAGGCGEARKPLKE